MVIDIFVIICGLYSFIYVVIALLISAGERRFRPGNLQSVLPAVSVIVCARNEEHNIHRCLESLCSLDYPREKLEIILVDDESEDQTLNILKEYTARDNIFRVFTTAGKPHDLPGKQRPLDLGIRHAKGEIVMVTDADCAVDPGWIRGHIAAYRKNTGIVGGITRISTDSGSLFAGLQNCDQVSKLAVAMGCAGLGFPLTIMGNNISFRREAYVACGGFEKIGPSIVEDMALMNAVIHDTGYGLGWAVEKRSVVVSTPERSFDNFIEQRRRWVHEIHDLSAIGKLMIIVESLMACVFGVSLLLVPLSPWILVICTLAWIFGYYLILWHVQGTEKKDFLFIPALLIFQIFYGIVLGFRSLFGHKKVIWKGRVYEEL